MGLSPGVLSQAVMPVKAGSLAAADQGRPRRAVGQLPRRRDALQGVQLFLGVGTAFDGRSAGHWCSRGRPLRPLVQLKAEHDGHDGQDGPADLAGPLGVGAEGGHPFGHPLTGQGEGQEGHGRPAGEDDGQHHVREADLGGGADGGEAVRIGPAHGVKRTPRPRPRTKPLEVPVG